MTKHLIPQRLFVYTFIRLFVYTFVYTFIRLFIRLYVYSFIRLFVYTLKFQPLNVSTHQRFNVSTLQRLNPSTSQRINPSTHQPLNASTPQRINASTPQRLNLSTNKRHRPPLLDAPPVHLGGSDATLHTRHGHDDAGEHLVPLLRGGRWQGLTPCHLVVEETDHRAQILACVIPVLGRCPSVDDVLQCVALACLPQSDAVSVHQFPCRAIAEGHGGELFKFLVRHYLSSPHPPACAATDIEGVVIADSSCHD